MEYEIKIGYYDLKGQERILTYFLMAKNTYDAIKKATIKFEVDNNSRHKIQEKNDRYEVFLIMAEKTS